MRDLVEFSKDKDILFSVGLPIRSDKKLYNAVILIKEGDIQHIEVKKSLKNSERGIFSGDGDCTIDDDGLYADTQLSRVIDISGIKIGVSVGEEELNNIPRSLELKLFGADIILNPSAFERYIGSKESIEERVKFLSKNVIYVHASAGLGESSTDFVYADTKLIGVDGEIWKGDEYTYLAEIEPSDELVSFNKFTKEDIKVNKFPYLPVDEYSYAYMTEAIEIGALGLLKRMEAVGTERTFLGLSGGLDSTMVLLIINKSYELGGFDKKNIFVYTMPAFGTSDRTKSNAYKLAKSLGLELREINISDSVKAHLTDIGHDGKTADTAYENAQARMRTQVLFDLANMYGGLVVGTGDLSESMQGFATFNGDHISNYSVNASLTKTELRYIVKSYAHFTDNKDLADVLTDILATPISPELKSEDKGVISQKTEEIIGPYELIDFFIYQHLTYHKSAKEILADATNAFIDKYDKETIKKWLISYFKRFTNSQFKRATAVDGPSITGRSYSPRVGFKIPSDMSFSLYLEGLDEE